MKRYVLPAILVLATVLFSAQYNNAADGTHIYTNDWRNGYSFSDREWAHPFNQHGYVDGLIDGLRYAKVILNTASRIEAFGELEQYYLGNPDKKQKPIIEVLIEKYKSE